MTRQDAGGGAGPIRPFGDDVGDADDVGGAGAADPRDPGGDAVAGGTPRDPGGPPRDSGGDPRGEPRDPGGGPVETASATFPSAAESVADARRFVVRVLSGWGMAEITDDAVLATSELATNAVTYAGTSFEVICRRDGDEARIEVRDHHPTRHIAMPDVDEVNGRGLPAIARLAAAWGVTYDRVTKGVWFSLPRHPLDEQPDDAPDAPGAAFDDALPSSADDISCAEEDDHVEDPGQDEAPDAPDAPDEAGGAGRDGRPGAAAVASRPGGGTRAVRPGSARARIGAAGSRAGRRSRAAGPGGATPGADRLLRSPAARESLEGAVGTVRDVLDADGAAVLLADRDGRLTLGASAGLAFDAHVGDLSVVNLGPNARGGGPWVSTDASDPIAAAMRARSLAAAPLQSEGRLIGVVAAVSSEPDRFAEADGKRLGRIAEEMALSMERARIGELERSWRGWLSFVAEASDLLAGTLDQERTMALVAQLVVPRLATWCAVHTSDDAGAARPAYVWHADETCADALREVLEQADPAPPMDAPGRWNGLAGAPEAARAAAGPLVHDVVYVFPLNARGRRIGAIVIGRPAGDRFPRGALDLAEELSRRAALAIDNARLYSAQTAMSSALQRSLLPPGIPEIPGLEVAVVYEPAGERSEVGGDFYDVFGCSADAAGRPRWRFAIGDVCGTGPEAAAVTGLARHALRILSAEDMTLPAVLDRLNGLILGEGPRARLLTLLHGEITPRQPDGVRIALVSAGHPLPLILDPDGTVTEAASPQPLLGVFDEVDFRLDLLELHRGQVLLCVTDGVTERRSGDRLLGDDQGLERLLAGCAGLSAGAVAARIQRAVRDFGTAPSGDDVALIVLRAG